MIVRCTVDDLLLHAEVHPARESLVICDGGEAFELEAVEALYYEVVAASREEVAWFGLRRYRLLRLAEDFRALAWPSGEWRVASGE